MNARNPTKAISRIIQGKDEEEPHKLKSREEFKKEKELEEARKLGNAPAAVDEEGRDINPHIPQYISSTPWYYDTAGPTLKHQRQGDERIKKVASLNEFFVRGQRGSAATKWRKGSCENCGAITHKKKDCLERPRKVGAKFSGEDIASDEVLPSSLSLDFDGKRDRWTGFDPMMYKQVIEDHAKIDEAKRLLKEEKLKTQDIEGNESDDSEADEKYADHIDMPGTKVDSKQRITVRNLRIREDTAKYLRNLDPESAYYDPKTRSMRENPYQANGEKPNQLTYAGDNFVRYSGETQKISQAQLFAWDVADKGIDIHLQAEPTKAELIHKEFDSKKEDIKETIKDSILSKYGGKEYLQAPPKELIFAQTEDYIEYSRSGKIIKGEEKREVKSKYIEDVHPNNHTSVWGSFWHAGKWGFKCCHSLIRNSYCTGELGKKRSLEEEFVQPDQDEEDDADEPQTSLLEQHQRKTKDSKNKDNKKDEAKSDDALDPEKLKKAIKKEEEMQRANSKLLKEDERKRKYNLKYENQELTAEEIEAYKIKRVREDDPMAKFMDK